MILDGDTSEAIADAVADRLADRPAQRFVDVRELALTLGVSADVIYRRADELGAIRVGSRILFDPVDVANRCRRQIKSRSSMDAPTRSLKRRNRPQSTVELLPIRGER
jgi:Zn-dependent peptidase ImmA (M78 family)